MNPSPEPFRATTRVGATALALLALTAPALAVAAASAAPADRDAAHRVVHRDAVRDVTAFDRGEGEATSTNQATDIIRTVVDHRAERLTVSARLRAIQRTGYRLLVSEIRTREGGHFWLEVVYTRKTGEPHVSLDSNRGSVECPGLTWALDRDRSRVLGSVPRSCLDDPGWVRVGVATFSAARNFSGWFIDDSRRDGSSGEDHLALGPRQPHA